jgi:hypothetical protein
VHIVRHPAGVIASQKGRQRQKGRRFDFQGELEYLGELMAKAENNARRLGRDRYHVVRYERLLSEPKRAMQEICGFIGIPFEDSVLRSSVNGELASPNSGDGELAANSGSLVHSSAERWRRELSPAEIAAVESYLGAAMMRLGYAAERRSPAAYLRAIIRIRRQYKSEPELHAPGVGRALWSWLRHRPAGIL